MGIFNKKSGDSAERNFIKAISLIERREIEAATSLLNGVNSKEFLLKARFIEGLLSTFRSGELNRFDDVMPIIQKIKSGEYCIGKSDAKKSFDMLSDLINENASPPLQFSLGVLCAHGDEFGLNNDYLLARKLFAAVISAGHPDYLPVARLQLIYLTVEGLGGEKNLDYAHWVYEFRELSTEVHKISPMGKIYNFGLIVDELIENTELDLDFLDADREEVLEIDVLNVISSQSGQGVVGDEIKSDNFSQMRTPCSSMENSTKITEDKSSINNRPAHDPGVYNLNSSDSVLFENKVSDNRNKWVIEDQPFVKEFNDLFNDFEPLFSAYINNPEPSGVIARRIRKHFKRIENWLRKFNETIIQFESNLKLAYKNGDISESLESKTKKINDLSEKSKQFGVVIFKAKRVLAEQGFKPAIDNSAYRLEQIYLRNRLQNAEMLVDFEQTLTARRRESEFKRQTNASEHDAQNKTDQQVAAQYLSEGKTAEGVTTMVFGAKVGNIFAILNKKK